MATGFIITKRMILHVLEELSGFFNTLVRITDCSSWKTTFQSTENKYVRRSCPRKLNSVCKVTAIWI